ncbi:MAG: RadC family protein [Clostridia bacterium]|nr:RadC family protein [Clostridia bacterium]
MHEGHRERLYAKFIEGDTSLTELETTEFLLCFSIARTDVKPLAAKLLESFGSLEGIFNATPEELMNVKGVGKKTAAFFKVMGDLIRSYNPSRSEEKTPNVYNTVMFFKEYFKNVETEQLVVALLGKNGEVIRKFIYTDYSRSEVNVNIKEIAAEIARIAPHSAVMAHNHFSGNVHPSLADDLTTRRIALMMNVHGVILYDHLIFCGDDYYSYHITGRLDKIKEEINDAVK